MEKLLSILFFIYGLTHAQVGPSTHRLGLDVSNYPQNAGVFNYDSCFAVGKNLGMTQVGIYQNWTALETAPTTYDLAIMDIANIYYPAKNMAIDLTIAPIHTNKLEVPSDLASVSFSNSVMITRFNRLLDSIKAHIPNVTLSSLVIGSEHDVYLGSNTLAWSDYTTFYNAVMVHARQLWPGLKVATELTSGGIVTYSAQAQNINLNSDHIGVSYYPLNPNFTVKQPTVVASDFTTLVNVFPSKKLWFYQYGYPSSGTCNSSNALQTQFITQTFLSWDTHAANIEMIDFTWLHDYDAAQVNFWGNYYGITNAAFLEFLRTLGLRTWNGNGGDKPAMVELRCQARQRGFNALPLNCTTGTDVVAFTEMEPVLYPNPASNTVFINKSIGRDLSVTLYAINGQVMDVNQIENEKGVLLDVSRLANGVYVIETRTGNMKFCKKLFVDHN